MTCLCHRPCSTDTQNLVQVWVLGSVCCTVLYCVVLHCAAPPCLLLSVLLLLMSMWFYCTALSKLNCRPRSDRWFLQRCGGHIFTVGGSPRRIHTCKCRESGFTALFTVWGLEQHLPPPDFINYSQGALEQSAEPPTATATAAATAAAAVWINDSGTLVWFTSHVNFDSVAVIILMSLFLRQTTPELRKVGELVSQTNSEGYRLSLSVRWWCPHLVLRLDFSPIKSVNLHILGLAALGQQAK